MKLFLTIAIAFIYSFGYSQSVLPFRGDTIRFYKQGGNAELVLQNSTRDTTGVLVNIGGGRTRFVKSRNINDSTIVVGNDTLNVGSGGTTTLYKDSTIYGHGTIDDPLGVDLSGLTGTGGTGVFAPELYFVNHPTNPTIPNAAETSLLMQANGTTADMWYRGLTGFFNADSVIYYTTATNSMLDNWSLPGTALNVHGFFPTVFKIGTTYYMFLKNRGGTAPADFNAGDIYLYTSTNKTTWTVMNGGAPAITHSATTTDWRNKIYNVAVAVVGTRLHILCDGWAASGAYANNYQAGYASADISSPTFTLPSTPTFSNAANPDMMYVPEKNAFLVAFNDLFYLPGGVYRSYMHFAKGSLTTDLLNPLAWEQSPWQASSLADLSLDGPHYPSDFSIAFTPGKAYPMTMTYCYDQAHGYQAYAPLVHTPLELFEAIPNPTGGSQFSDVPTGIAYSGGNVGVGTTNPTQTLDVVVNTNAERSVSMTNQYNGTSAASNFLLKNSTGRAGGLTLKAQNYTTYGALGGNDLAIYSGQGVNQVYMTDDAAAVIKWASGGNQERMRLDSIGRLRIFGMGNGSFTQPVGVDAAGNLIPFSQWAQITTNVIKFTGTSSSFSQAIVASPVTNTAAIFSAQTFDGVEARMQANGAVDAFIGTVSNHPFNIYSNSIKRIAFPAASGITFSEMTGTGNALMALSSTGIASRASGVFHGSLITPDSLTDLTLAAGSIGLQGLGADNGIIASNIEYKGSGIFRYRSAGYGSTIQPVSGGWDFSTAPSGSTGATATLTRRMNLSNTGSLLLDGLAGTGERAVKTTSTGELTAGPRIYGTGLAYLGTDVTYSVHDTVGSVFWYSSAGGVPMTLNLPAAASYPGRILRIRNAYVENMTLSPGIFFSTGTPARTVLLPDQSIEIQSNGSQWVQIGANFNGS